MTQFTFSKVYCQFCFTQFIKECFDSPQMVIPLFIVYDGIIDVSLAMLDSSYYGVD